MDKEIKFTKIKYETIEFEDEFETAIGHALLYNKKVCNVEIYDSIIRNKKDIDKIRKFLDEVEKMEWIRKTDSVVG